MNKVVFVLLVTLVCINAAPQRNNNPQFGEFAARVTSLPFMRNDRAYERVFLEGDTGVPAEFDEGALAAIQSEATNATTQAAVATVTLEEFLAAETEARITELRARLADFLASLGTK